MSNTQIPPEIETPELQHLFAALEQTEQHNSQLRHAYEQAQQQIQHLQDELHRHKKELRYWQSRPEQTGGQVDVGRSRYFDLLPIGMATLSPQRVWMEVNLAMGRMLGYDAEELPGKTLADISHPQDLPFSEATLARMEAGEIDSFMQDKRFLHRDHRVIYTNVVTHCLRRPDDSVDSFICLVQDITERKRAEDDLRIFQTLMENAPDGVVVASLDGTLIYHNRAFGTMHACTDAISMKNTDFIAPADHTLLPAIDEALRTQGTWQGGVQAQRQDGTTFPAWASIFLMYDKEGNPSFVGVTISDRTDIQQAEEARSALQEEIIQVQQHAIRELSSPLLPIGEQVVVMPLVGSIDSNRAQQIMDTLLDGVATHHAEVVILDVTGVQVADTQVAATLVGATQAAGLLGAQVVVTGIGPAMAQTLVHLGADLSNIKPLSTLQQGIAYALKR
jgi:PAS domain S-box-containing protein